MTSGVIMLREPNESRKRQQALAEFGDFVLDHEDLDDILTEGCRLIAHALGADLAKVLQIESQSNTALVRAGVGWRDGIVGKERICLTEDSSEAFAIETCQPVISNDVAQETRFHFPRFLRDEGVVALVNVPIFLPGRKPWGVLQVDARRVRAFDDEDIDFLKTYAMTLGPVIDRLLVAAQQEEAPKQIRERDARLRQALDEMGEGFCLLAPDFTIREHNQQALRLAGRLADDVIGKSHWEVYPRLEHSDAGKVLRDAMKHRKRMSIDHPHVLPTGQEIWLNLHAYPAQDGNLALVWRDITEHRRAQHQLQASEEWLQSALKVARIALWDWNVATGEVNWSDEHYLMQGYKIGEVAPSYQAWLDRVHPDEREAQDAAVRSSMATGDDYVAEFRTSHPDGSVHWVSARGRFFYDDQKQPLRMIGAAIDVTQPKVLQERQRVLVAELQHRTRNLMGVIRSIAYRTARSSRRLADFHAKFQERLGAMARVQGLLSRLADDDRVTFEELLETELVAISGDAVRASVVLDGPRGIRLRSSTVQTLAMALHELATNALKYGALHQKSAQLAVSWRYEEVGEMHRPWLHIDWRESGVKMPGPHRRPQGGDGRELIEIALPYQLGARTTYELAADGVHCSISVPVSETTGVEEPSYV